MGRTNRILLVDDNPGVRADLRTLLDLLEGVDVVGEAARAGDVIRKASETEPDVVIMDLELGELLSGEIDAFAAIRELKRARPQGLVFVLTVHGYPAARQAAMRAGADAFFTKGQDMDRLLEAIKASGAPETGTQHSLS